MANAQAVERILSQATTVTLADLAMTFASTFPGQDTFTAACHLYMFYKEEEQSTQSEIILQRRIAILFVLCNLYGPDTLERNPFLSFFLELLDTLDSDAPEKLTVQCLLCGSSNTIQSCTALELARNPSNLIPLFAIDKHRLHTLQIIEQQLTDDSLQETKTDPGPISPNKVEVSVVPNEPALGVKQSFDSSLMKDAFDYPLSIAQQENLLQMIEVDPANLKDHLPSERLPDLIENNQTIATEALNVLAQLPEFSEYLQILLTIDITNSTMEVVHRLLIGPHRSHVPDEFLHIYLSNCIRSCELIDDRSLQSRQVRLVSVFIQSLLRNNVINISDFLIEIQSFCIEFSRHRGAASLFRIVAEQANNADYTLSQSSENVL